jgi:hypothetical protein
MGDKRGAARPSEIERRPRSSATRRAELPDDLRRAVDRLERGDLDGAKRVTRRIARRCGSVPSVTAHYLSMLQDDPMPYAR